MKPILLVLAVLLAGCNETASRDLTYDQLVNYPSQCAKADEQLRELKALEARKNFNEDPDTLNDADRAYNSRLKASIWWYAYRCEK